jgi:hypothetical protein
MEPVRQVKLLLQMTRKYQFHLYPERNLASIKQTLCLYAHIFRHFRPLVQELGYI